MNGSGDIAPHPTVAWFHCFAGIAGDMALGSLIDAGADLAEIRQLLQRLSLPGWELTTEEALRGGVACTRAIVVGGDDVVVRTHAHIVGLITDARRNCIGDRIGFGPNVPRQATPLAIPR